MTKKYVAILFFILASYMSYSYFSDGFSVHNIVFPESIEVETPLIQDEVMLRKVVQQPFRYLGKGRQSYVFVSQDGKWVLKFFKCQRLRVSSIYEWAASCGIFSEKIQQKKVEKRNRAYRLFESAAIVGSRLSQEAGVSYMQLAKGDHPLPHVTLINAIGLSFDVDLATTPFCLQRCGQPVLETLRKLIEQGHIEQAKERLDQILVLLIEKRKKGVEQHDKALVTRNNIGFVAERALFLDIGSFSLSHTLKRYQHEKKQMKPLIRDLRAQNKELSLYFQNKVDAL